jgi:integrase
MSSIRRKRTGTYEARYRDPSSKQRGKVFKTKREAEKFLARVDADMQRGNWLDPAAGRVTYAEIAEEWLRTVVHLKPRTVSGYRNLLNDRLLPTFGGMAVSRIVRSTVRAYVAGMVAEGKAPQTVRNAFWVLSASLNIAVENGAIAVNPCTGVKLPSNASTGREIPKHFLTSDQVNHLAESIQPEYGTLIHFAVATGLRFGELAALRVEDVNDLRRQVRVRSGLGEVDGRQVRGTTKNRKERTIGLPRYVVEMLAEDLNRAYDSPLFTDSNGAALRHGTFYRPVYQRAVKAAGLDPLRFHDLRHTCASLLIDQGANVKAIAERLGHSDGGVLVLRTYGHLFAAHDADVTDRLDAAYDKGRVVSSVVTEA